MKIILVTLIQAPIETCFDLSRSIDLHVESMKQSNEKAIDGTTTGLINLHETVTWKAKHFGVNFKMKIKITEMNSPLSFTDEMMTGPFQLLKHQHKFKSIGLETEMTDIFEFKALMGFLGRLAEKLFLGNYMTKLLIERNRVIKKAAES